MANEPAIRLTVVENATQKSVTGATVWATVRRETGSVVVEATTGPNNVAQEWSRIKWGGDKTKAVPGKPNRRAVPRSRPARYHIEAKLGGATAAIEIWVVRAALEVQTKGRLPGNAAPFDPQIRDRSDKLGAVTYESLTSSVIDEAAGIFVTNMGASGKVAVVARLLPVGANAVLQTGWSIEREVWTHNWLDGFEAARTNKAWEKDTSKPQYLRLVPDRGGKIYDTDGPDLRWGERTYETYNNFRQWVTWNGEVCSAKAEWYWQARWKLDRRQSRQITLNELGKGNIRLPKTPFYPAAKKK